MRGSVTSAIVIESARPTLLTATVTWDIAGVSPSSPHTMERIVSNVSLEYLEIYLLVILLSAL